MPTTKSRLKKNDAIEINSVATTRFGIIEVVPEQLIHFNNGLIGFESQKRFVLIKTEQNSPFQWLQSLDLPWLAFPTMDPWLFQPDYSPTISDVDCEEVDLQPADPRAILVIVTVPRDRPQQMTANLLGPVLINLRNRLARQIIVENEDYETQHLIYETLVARCDQQAA